MMEIYYYFTRAKANVPGLYQPYSGDAINSAGGAAGPDFEKAK